MLCCTESRDAGSANVRCASWASLRGVAFAVAVVTGLSVGCVSSAAAQTGPSPYPAEPPPPPATTAAEAAGVQPAEVNAAPPTAAAGAPAQPPSTAGSEQQEPEPALGVAPAEAAPSAPAAAESSSLTLEPLSCPRCSADDGEENVVSHRELGGHHFPLAVFVPPALTYSYVGVRAGIEYHSVPGYSRDLSFFNTGYSRATLETVNAAETLDVALQLHDYIALVGSAYGLARVGANVPTLLGTGADYVYGGDAGLLVKLFRVAGFQLALRGEVGYFAGQQAGIIELFQDIGEIVQTNINDLVATTDIRDIDLPQRLADIENSIRVATSAMLTPFRGLEYGGAVNAAQSLGPMCGLQLSLGFYGKAETYDIPVFDARSATITSEPRDVYKFSPRVGVALDVDLRHVLMPLDVMAEYTLTRLTVRNHLPDGVSERVWTEHVVALGGYYSGALNLQLGVIAYVLYGKEPIEGADAQPSGEPLDVGSQFVFRYTR